MKKIISWIILFFYVFLPACSDQYSPVKVMEPSQTPWIITPDSPGAATKTPFMPAGATFTPTRLITSATPFPSAVKITSTAIPVISTPVNATSTIVPTIHQTIPGSSISLGFSGVVPEGIRKKVVLPSGWKVTEPPVSGDAQLGLVSVKDAPDSIWFFALVAPFPTLTDEVSLEDIQRAWTDIPGGAMSGRPLLVSPETAHIFEAIWGKGKNIQIIDASSLLTRAWEQRPSWAIIPFENLEPRWKVMRVDGDSPLDPKMDINHYPLKVAYKFSGKQEAVSRIQQQKAAGKAIIPETNRDPRHLTTLLMTGVTALVRATGAKMDVLGVKYPGKDIRAWLVNANLTHISNEIPFASNCPKANPYQESLIFCSRPEYIELLDDIGTDIVELTGNHMMDWGADAFRFTLDLYQKRKWTYYAAGNNIEEARKAAFIEHNGNKFAFIGCNPVGPASDWARSGSPGSANCDYPWLKNEISRLRGAGYIPIMTFQYQESYTFKPTPGQQRDFRSMAESGAAIVSGSQSHFPQTIEFYADQFIHYGLGNLFFDQMDDPVVGTRREFLDRHIFYENKHISTELLTALLEDYSRPRPMKDSERSAFLTDIFRASGW